MPHPLDTTAALLELALHRVVVDDDPMGHESAAAHMLADVELQGVIISGGLFDPVDDQDPRSAQQLVAAAWEATGGWVPLEPAEHEFLVRLHDLAHR